MESFQDPTTGVAVCGRGQSSVIGMILVVGFTIMGITGILLFGSTAILDAQDQSEVDAAEHAMTQLDSRFSLVALGSSEHQSAAIVGRSGTSVHVDGDRGWMNVTTVNKTNGNLEMTVFNTTLGAVIYENDETTIAYQGGGVWKKAPTGGSVMVSPPEFHYRKRSGQDPTLTLPLVVVRGQGTINQEARISKSQTVSKFPVAGSSDRSNPLEDGEINVTVQSEYYEAWGSFFEQRTGGDVTYDHDRNRVTITLGITQTSEGVEGGIVSSAAGEELDFENQAEADSYNSSDGDYAATAADHTKVVAAGGVKLQNQATLKGDLEAAGSVTLQNKAEITGNVSYGGSLTNDGTIGGEVDSDANVAVPDSVRWLIDQKRNETESSNDNSDPPIDASSDVLKGCDTTCTLNNGDYILQNVSLGSGETLELDTSGGEVHVVVREDMTVQGKGNITVTGDGTARFYLEGDLMIQNQGNVSVPGERAPGLWVYMNPGAQATIQNQGRFVGVVFGPGDGANPGVDISLDNQATVYGGVVGAVDGVDNGIGLHFDEALVDEDPLAGYGTGKATVTYMHVTLNEVDVSSG